MRDGENRWGQLEPISGGKKTGWRNHSVGGRDFLIIPSVKGIRDVPENSTSQSFNPAFRVPPRWKTPPHAWVLSNSEAVSVLSAIDARFRWNEPSRAGSFCEESRTVSDEPAETVATQAPWARGGEGGVEGGHPIGTGVSRAGATRSDFGFGFGEEVGLKRLPSGEAARRSGLRFPTRVA